jgi:Cu-Zn family superoxide dismutase
MKAKAYALALLIPCAVLTACNKQPAPPAEPPTTMAPAEPATPTGPPVATEAPGTTMAQARLTGKSGSTATGQLQLTQVADGVMIAGELTGLPPNSTHGFHVHEKGDCSAPDASSAGGHFNPTMAQHGGPESAMKHLGDAPNIKSDASGNATLSASIVGATLKDGGANDLIGKAIVVHAKRDDYKTQPSGDSGDRIACGVVE